MSTAAEYTTALNAVIANGNLERDPVRKKEHAAWKEEELRLVGHAARLRNAIVAKARAMSPDERKTFVQELLIQRGLIGLTAEGRPMPLFKA
ncbi:MAG TPA: hypothetical protein VMB73_18260 [Acetobacteraceae bacterium]|nr:hypothetical protein [Acetobacteraceae bacterium]